MVYKLWFENNYFLMDLFTVLIIMRPSASQRCNEKYQFYNALIMTYMHCQLCYSNTYLQFKT